MINIDDKLVDDIENLGMYFYTKKDILGVAMCSFINGFFGSTKAFHNASRAEKIMIISCMKICDEFMKCIRPDVVDISEEELSIYWSGIIEKATQLTESEIELCIKELKENL